MINRRRPQAAAAAAAGTPTPSGTPAAPSPPLSKTPKSPKSTAYVPLRRPSAPLSPPLTGAGPSPVPLPGPAPYTHLRAGYGYGSYGGSLSGFPFDDEEKPPATAVQVARRVIKNVRDGVRDAARLDRSWGVVWGDMELRAQVIKLTLLNLLSLTLLSLFPFVLSPIIHGNDSASLRASQVSQVSLWYNVFLSWPAFALVFWVNSLWGPDVARRAQTLLHPAYRHQPMSATGGTPQLPSFVDDPVAWTWMAFTRLLLIADFTFVFRVALLVPVLGWPLGLTYMALINSYYAYEWIFVSRAWGLDFRCTYISDRAAYMFGFGLPATLLTTFGPPMVNMAVFTLIYPFLLIQALQSRPPTVTAILPNTPSGPLTPTSPEAADGLGAPSIPRNAGGAKWLAYARVPVFFFARHLLTGTRFLVEACMRERGGYAARMRGKRAY